MADENHRQGVPPIGNIAQQVGVKRIRYHLILFDPEWGRTLSMSASCYTHSIPSGSQNRAAGLEIKSMLEKAA
ncbi:hypothetical protein [Lunatimonas salinarum]|uniref:hypothetical protein n=1 Tax=Lunatimonas salinarum TaxID=1774590 RepID=UPI001ADF02B5|nr:hypothetical protein [Lunatimonas salinarum]